MPLSGPDGALYVCNNGRAGATAGIQRVDVEIDEFATIYDACDGVLFDSPNDLVFDPHGNLRFTDYGAGVVYCAAADGSSIRPEWDGLRSPNGVGLSPDGAILYVALTWPRQVVRRSVVAPGRLEQPASYNWLAFGDDRQDQSRRLGDRTARRSTARFPCAGRDRSYLRRHTSGEWYHRDLARWLERGQPHTSPHLADPAVTNICFDGVNVRTAYITLSRTGRLISCRWPVPGLRLNFSRESHHGGT